jgi:ABC-type Na+ efflux pump permease subunit
MAIPIPYVHVGIGILTVLLSIPLILRIVPMNRMYGIRVRRAFVSPHNWYAINAYGGKLLLAFGLLLLLFSWFGQDYAPAPTSIWAPIYLIMPFLALLPMLAMINAFARRLPER